MQTTDRILWTVASDCDGGEARARIAARCAALNPDGPVHIVQAHSAIEAGACILGALDGGLGCRQGIICNNAPRNGDSTNGGAIVYAYYRNTDIVATAATVTLVKKLCPGIVFSEVLLKPFQRDFAKQVWLDGTRRHSFRGFEVLPNILHQLQFGPGLSQTQEVDGDSVPRYLRRIDIEPHTGIEVIHVDTIAGELTNVKLSLTLEEAEAKGFAPGATALVGGTGMSRRVRCVPGLNEIESVGEIGIYPGSSGLRFAPNSGNVSQRFMEIAVLGGRACLALQGDERPIVPGTKLDISFIPAQ